MDVAVSPAFHLPCFVARKALERFERSGFDPLAIYF